MASQAFLHKEEIRKLIGKTVERGMTRPCRSVLLRAATEEGGGQSRKGKKDYDKRETIKRRETGRETRGGEITPVLPRPWIG